MDTILVAGAIILGLGLIFGVGFKEHAKSSRPVITQMGAGQSEDAMHYLSTLRRELANHLIWNDPDHYVNIYKSVHDEISAFEVFRPEDITSRLSGLCKTFPHCANFDALATREYILYGDAFCSHSYEEIKNRYVNIIRFQALTILTGKGWETFHATTDEELKHILEYARRVKDTQFKSKLRRAINEFSMFQKSQNRGEMTIFENLEIIVRSVSHFVEVRYGIHFKQTGEYGLYAFSRDQNGDRTQEHFYRSDAAFQLEQSLDAINGIE